MWASWDSYRKEERLTTEIPSGGDIPSALFFPADYSVGMANLGYHYIYRCLRELGVAVERFFLSPIPYRSVDKDTLFERFSLFVGSISYEGDIPVFAKWLFDGGINPLRSARDSAGGALVGAGGAITYINPLGLSGIADFIILGDGLPVLPYVIDSLRLDLSRDGFLRRLAENPAILVPKIHLSSKIGTFSLKVSKQTDITSDYGFGTWVTPRTVFGNTLLVELQRGCLRGCRYCTLPSCFSPFRQRALDLVQSDIERIAAFIDFDQVGLITPEASDYKGLNCLLDTIDMLGKSVSFASLRLDGLTEKIIHMLVRGGRYSVTVAPESGDDVLRKSCGKNFNNDMILEALQMVRNEGITSVKLYFMIGLPGETDEHILSIAGLCERIRLETGLKITITVSPFIPKPGTSWRSAGFFGDKELKRRYLLLKRAYKIAMKAVLPGISTKEACAEYRLSWATSEMSETIVENIATGRPYKCDISEVDRSITTFELNRLGFLS